MTDASRSTCTALIALLLLSGSVRAQSIYPDKPIRLVIPFGAGGGTDIAGRRLAAKIGTVLGQNIIVDNKGGNDGAIGSADVAGARPDGYTLLMGTSSSHAIMPSLKKLPYDPVEDFSHIAIIGITPMVFAVHPAVATSLQDFVNRARAQPGKYSYGSTGTGGLVHLSGELLKLQAGGLDIVNVPYKGSGQSYQDLIAGHIPSVIASISVMLPNHRMGKVRILAVLTEKRSSSAPDIPTATEQGIPGVLAYTFNVLCAPARTPKAIVDRLHQATQKSMQDPLLRKDLEGLGIEPVTDSSPDKAQKFLSDELVRWSSVIKSAGIKAM